MECPRKPVVTSASWKNVLGSIRSFPVKVLNTSSKSPRSLLLSNDSFSLNDFTAPWSRQKHQQSRSPRVSAETTERDPMACRTMAVGAQCYVVCDSCSHTGNILVSQHALQAGSAAAAASARKSSTERSLPLTCFFPVAVETLGTLSDEAHSLIAEIGRRATLCTADPRETTSLYQRISVSIQPYNAVCLANTFSFRVPIVPIPDIHFFLC